MPKYRFQAKAANGSVQTGQLEAASETEVATLLKTQGMTPIRVLAAPGTATAAAGSSALGGFMVRRVASKDLQIFTRQFSTLINAGITVSDSLRMLSEGKRDPQLKEAAEKVRAGIENGKRLGDAMSQSPLVFDKFYVNMVRAGEEAGILEGILLRLATYLEKSEKIKKQVKGAMAYPAVVLFVAGIVIAGILVFIIPKFQEIFASSGNELPAVTQMVVNMSQFLIKKWYYAVIGMIAIPYLFMTWYKTEEGKKTMDRIVIRAPVFGELTQKSAVAKMTRTLSTLLSSGVGVIEALDIAAKTAGNSVIEDALNRCKESVMAGKPLAAPLAKEKNIPDMVTQMISIGEQSGNMDTMLGKIADFYEDDVENAVKAMTTMIEPLMMVFLGGIIAFLVVAMYLPIFSMANNI